MAQKSKKAQIAVAALPLFLENGFKGTSIDMVVKASGVAKATVYNHYPDKAALMLATMTAWVDLHKPLITPVQSAGAFNDYVEQRWLTDETVRMYALVIGEGWRFRDARQVFWTQFDALWRKALDYLADSADDVTRESVELQLDHRLLQRLRKL